MGKKDNLFDDMILDGEKQKKKAKITKKGIIIFISIIVILLIGISAVILNLPKNTDKHIIIADEIPQELIYKEKTEEEIVDTSVKKEDSAVTSNKLSLGNNINIDLKVNTMLDGESTYSDHDAYINLEFSDFISGFDNVSEVVNQYNENSTTKINLGDKDTFYETSVGNEIVMYKFVVSVPEDFPTNDYKHGYTGLQPEFSIIIKGTEKEDALITDMYEFAIPSVTDISDDTSEFLIGKSYNLMYITLMPKGMESDKYSLSIMYKNNEDARYFDVDSVNIPE